MSSNIYYRFVDASKSLRVGASSSFIESMTRVFGSHPWMLTGADHDKLNAMAAIYGGLDLDNPYVQLRDLVLDSDGDSCAIEVWPQY